MVTDSALAYVASLLRKTHRCALNVVWTLTNNLKLFIIVLMTCICQLTMKSSQDH